MSGKVQIGGKWKRPSFNYHEEEPTPLAACAAQLAESSRNLLEDLLEATEETNRLLRRIERRMATVAPLSKRKGRQ